MSLPSYQELADLLAELIEANIANIDKPESRFVSCFTYGTGRIPDYWWRALQAREALIAGRVVPRGEHGAKTFIRNRRGRRIK